MVKQKLNDTLLAATSCIVQGILSSSVLGIDINPRLDEQMYKDISLVFVIVGNTMVQGKAGEKRVFSSANVPCVDINPRMF